MAEQKKRIRIELTEEQKEKIRQETGKEASSMEFESEELEERVAPARFAV